MLARYQLGQIYASLRVAARQGRWPQASELLGTALGFELPGRPGHAEIAQALKDHCIRQLSYRGFKPAELAMLRGGIKPVVKMEDIPLAQARQWLAELPHGIFAEIGEPYRKDYLLLRSAPCDLADPEALVCVYAGQAAAVADLRSTEAKAREDAQAAGRILAIPDCCSRAFAADFAKSRQDQDALNDDANRRLLSQATAGDPGPWQLNPLSDAELLGYYPCSLRCEASARRAAAVLEQLRLSDPPSATAAATRLARPCLFWRVPFFAVIDGHWQTSPLGNTSSGVHTGAPCEPVLRYRAVLFNVFADPVARAIQGLLAAHLMPILRRGDNLSIGNQGLTIRQGDRTIAHFESDPSVVPLVTAWH